MSDDRSEPTDEDGSSGDGQAGDPGESASSGGDWTDLIVGERMQVDGEFGEKVAASNFSRQQWGLIMTAVEFDIENADDPETARLVADTSKLEAVLPELERMEESRGGPPGGGGAGMGGGGGGGGGGSSGGFIDNVKESLGLGGDDSSREQRAAAEEMAQMYADDLQEKLETTGKWEQVRLAASE